MSHIPKLRFKWLDGPMWMITMTAYGLTWFFLFLLLMLSKYIQSDFLPRQELFLYCLYAPLIAWIAGIFIKKLLNRERPNVPGVNKLDTIVKDKSFPSSHTSSAVAFAVSLALFGHPLWAIISIWALIVSFSRYYVAVHYPSDIVAGAGLGALCAVLIYSF